MPVLPDDGSRIVSPTRSSPASSASSIILSAMRSFEEPPGFCPSSLAKILTSGLGDSACTPTSGVSPMTPRMFSWRTSEPFRVTDRAVGSASRHRGQDRDDVAVGHLGVELLEVADVVVVHVHVHELVQAAGVVDQLALEARVPLGE